MNKKKYLIDVNLPYYFSLWHKDEYLHQIDLGDDWEDSAIWDYAKEHDLTIVTKDSDFSNRMILHKPPLRVIHIRIRNMKMREFFQTISGIWDKVVEVSDNYKLVNVFTDRIEGIK